MKRQTVSLCLIARDEEASIGTAIKSALALVDEVVVADTGSRDNTRIIAEGYGARVVDVPWEDDFSAARNAALDQASCDWILVLDADEILQSLRPVEFQRLLQDPAAAGYRLRLLSPHRTEEDDRAQRVRLFRNVPVVRYRYPIHERVTPSLERWAEAQGLAILDARLTVMHEPAELSAGTQKRERNLRILRKAVESHPEEPYFSYRLGCAGLATLDEEVLPVAGLAASLGHLQAAWGKAGRMPAERRIHLGWLPDLAARLASGLLALGDRPGANRILEQARESFPDHPAILLQAAAAGVADIRAGEEVADQAMSAGRIRADLDHLVRAWDEDQAGLVDSRVRNLYPLRYRGELALLEGRVAEAVGYFEQALDLDPDYTFGWLGMAECSVFAGDRKRALKLYLRTVADEPGNHRAWLAGCGLMAELDFPGNAESWWRQLAERFPEHPAVKSGAGAPADPVPA